MHVRVLAGPPVHYPDPEAGGAGREHGARHAAVPTQAGARGTRTGTAELHIPLLHSILLASVILLY